MGGGAATLGLTGEVSEQGIVRLLEARDPATGELLREPVSAGTVAGFDLAFRAPKSVSILFGIAEPEAAREVVAAHDGAVAEAMAYMEREACRARRGRGGAIVIDGRGFVGAAFRHRSSRAGDPQLHTHIVVGNATQSADGRWTALDGRALYRHAKTAGYLYQAVLRAELSERLPVRWLAVERGTADLAGVPRGVIVHFSQRRAEILEHMAARGERSARAAQIATLETRRTKGHDVPADRLRAAWRARAAEHGLNRFQLRRVFRQPPRRSLDEDTILEDVARRLEGPEGLTRERSRFTRRDVVQAFAEAAARGARVAEIERRATAFLDRDEIVALESGSREPEYTTRSLLLIEDVLLDGADGRRATGVAVARSEAIAAALGARRSLSREQRDLVVALTRSGDGVQIVRSAAGTGKTFALGAAVDAWQASGKAILGCSLSARAACELRDQTGVDATTLASLSRALNRGLELSAGAVLIVDEAGMVGTRDLAALAAAAQRANVKLVLVGDDHQLPEIRAGGAFAALARRLGAAELREVRRQSHAWDRAALAALREGDGDAFARAYLEHGRIIAAPSAEAARAAMVEDWYAAYKSGATAIMIAHRRADVADLNARAREKLRALGRLGDHQVTIGARTFARGDRVVTTRNDRRLNVVNGQAGVIMAIGGGGCEVRFHDGRRVQLPERYVRGGHLDHGYASTAHRAQGATVDRTFVLGSDELYREWGYTALSRHRQGARFYVTAARSFINAAPTPLQGGRRRRVPGRAKWLTFLILRPGLACGRASSARKIRSRPFSRLLNARGCAASAGSSDHGCPERACIGRFSRRRAAPGSHRLAHATRCPDRTRRGRAPEDPGLNGVRPRTARRSAGASRRSRVPILAAGDRGMATRQLAGSPRSAEGAEAAVTFGRVRAVAIRARR
jgi:conjugative relaxase-like TrwC/TraI family protein